MILVVIPARGGSKGVPRKNIKELNGKPLIQYTIEAARNIFKDEQIVVSTDSPEIKKIVENIGLKVPFLRPPELALDEVGTYEVLLHAINFVEEKGFFPEVIILLQPTSPFRKSHHIIEAISCYNSNLDMVISVKETTSNPYYVLREENEKGFLQKIIENRFMRRQDCPKVWELNGAIYVININSLKKKPIHSFERVKKYEMDEISSHDIDTPFDWKLAEILVKSL